jgi:hypothetical protein
MQPIRLFLICLIFANLTCTTRTGAQINSGSLEETVLKAHYDSALTTVKAFDVVLPAVLSTSNGKTIKKSKDWEELRRPEVLELFTTQVYGRIPETPFLQSIKVVKVDPNAMEGKATLKLVDITISANDKTLTIHLGLFVPNSQPKPVPAFLLICNRPKSNIDFTREKKSDFWPAEQQVDRGYAAAAFWNDDVDPDQHDNFQNGIHGLLDAQRTPESWGTLAAWAWGASRCMDYLVTDKMINPEKIALVGHSRGAKTALWAGANDTRFAMIVSNEAGCGGTSLSKRKYGETIALINKGFPHWFCGNFKSYNQKEEQLPLDQHMLLALIAPRPLYIASAEKDLWGDPVGQYLALWFAAPVYKLYDPSSNLPKLLPMVNTPVISRNLAYHVRDGLHNLTLKDWNWFMDFGDVVLK